MPKQHQDKVDVAAIVSSEQPFPIAWPKRVKDAIDAIVERGIAYNEAAAESGLTTRTMRLALERPHVLAYLKQQLKVLRDARGPRNFHRLCAIADAADRRVRLDLLR